MKRAYVMAARAEEARRTGERILAAALDRFSHEEYDRVTLESIATDAGVTTQTVIRRYQSKEGLVRTLAQIVTPRIESQRGLAPVGDIPGAVANLVDHYEAEGELVLHLLRQAPLVPAYAELTALGARVHAEWTTRVFAPWLATRSGVARDRLVAQLIAVGDVATWHLLRHQRGLSRRQTQVALVELVAGLLR